MEFFFLAFAMRKGFGSRTMFVWPTQRLMSRLFSTICKILNSINLQLINAV
jgi:hypothetical protein